VDVHSSHQRGVAWCSGDGDVAGDVVVEGCCSELQVFEVYFLH
jgi:hypothetical protein